MMPTTHHKPTRSDEQYHLSSFLHDSEEECTNKYHNFPLELIEEFVQLRQAFTQQFFASKNTKRSIPSLFSMNKHRANS